MANFDLIRLVTESRNRDTLYIDSVSTFDMVKMMNNEDKKVADAVELELHQIAKAIDEIWPRIKKGGRIIYIGAGTSGRLGILDASECPPTFGVSPEVVQGIIAGGYEAIFRAKEGVEDSKEHAIVDLKERNVNEYDVLIGLAASGRTPYVISALEYGNKINALTIGITCNKDTEICNVSSILISPVVGAEVITGSTRLKAGTAQKMILNMISTGVMIKLGKVYGNLMVDVKATNEKLCYRAINIVREATGEQLDVCKHMLSMTNYDVKLTIFMILSGLDIDKAREVLSSQDGYITKALKSIK